jgi:hypothetical protein
MGAGQARKLELLILEGLDILAYCLQKHLELIELWESLEGPTKRKRFYSLQRINILQPTTIKTGPVLTLVLSTSSSQPFLVIIFLLTVILDFSLLMAPTSRLGEHTPEKKWSLL